MPSMKDLQQDELWPVIATVSGATFTVLFSKRALTFKQTLASVLAGLFCGYFVTPVVVDVMNVKTWQMGGFVGALIGLSGTQVVALMISAGPGFIKTILARTGVSDNDNGK